MMSVSPVLCRLLLVLLFVGALHAQTRPDFLDFTSWMMVDASPSLSVLLLHLLTTSLLQGRPLRPARCERASVSLPGP